MGYTAIIIKLINSNKYIKEFIYYIYYKKDKSNYIVYRDKYFILIKA